MDGGHEWNRRLFETLTSNRLSRNKYFNQFTNKSFKAVHKRYRVVSSLVKDASRLGIHSGTVCWITNNGDGPIFHLQSPSLRYFRQVPLRTYEWEWLEQQEEIRSLLQSQTRDGLSGGGAFMPVGEL